MTPILYSFRRCPYAMRARLAINSSGQDVRLREVVLRDKPAEMLAASPKGTVPVLVIGDAVIDESFDIMKWALAQSDPQGWLDMPEEGYGLIAKIEGPFKTALDRFKYHTRYDGADPDIEHAKAIGVLRDVTENLQTDGWLFGDRVSLADMAILPFVRQFAASDRARFDGAVPASVREWLDRFLALPELAHVMRKYPQWQTGEPGIAFPESER